MVDRSLGARSGLMIGVAFLTASALGFALLAILARWLTPEQNAQFLAIWGLVFGIGSALSAVEQEVVRLATTAHLNGTNIPGRAVQVTGFALVVAILFLIVIVQLPGVGGLLRDSVLVCSMVFVATGGFAILCLSRAVLLGTSQVVAYVSVVVAEALLRLLLAAGFVLGGVEATLGLATAVIIIGCFGWFPVARRVAQKLELRAERSTLRSVVSTVGALGLANGLAAVQVTAFPAVASTVIGASATTASHFGAVTLARLPLVALAPVQAMAVPVATRLIRTGRHEQLVRLVTRLSLGGAACASAAFVGGWLLGPWALRLFMGDSYVVAPGVMAVLLAASCILAVALLEVAAIIALEGYWTAVAVWSASAGMLVMTLTLPTTTDVKVAGGVAAGAVTAWALASFAVVREARRRQLTGVADISN